VPIRGTVSHISAPIRIVLAVAVIFMAAWMTVLKPKDDTSVATEPTGNVATGQPAVSAPGKAAEAAKSAVENANAKSAAGEAAVGAAPATTGTATTPSTADTGTTATGAAKPGAALTGLPKPVAKALAADKVLVLLFWNKDSADDRAVKQAVAKADRWGGRVSVQTASIESIAKYGRVTRGVDVQQSPTVVVVDRDLEATALVGYVDRQTVDQAVVDALRASGGLFTSTYLRKVNALCASVGRQLWAVPQASAGTNFEGYMKRQGASVSSFVADLRAITPPARYRAFARANAADFAALSGVYSTAARSVSGKADTKAEVTAVLTAARAEAPIARRVDARMDSHHVISCGSNG
jgi:hypothetical protein